MMSAQTADTRGDRTRKAIKRAVAKLAERKDLTEISLVDICRSAKMTSGALYFHFKGKDEAIEEMVIDEIEALYGAILKRAEGLPIDALLDGVLQTGVQFHRSRKRLAKAIQVVINTRPRAYAAWIDARQPILAELERAVGEHRRKAKLPTVDSSFLAVMILNASEDVGMDAFQWQNPMLATFSRHEERWIAWQKRMWTHMALADLREE